jgi:uncharacterized protein
MQPGSPWLLVGIGVLSFVLAIIGAAVGLILGHLRLPLLIAYLGSPTGGAMMNLLVSGTGALGASVSHARAGRVSWRGVALIGIPSGIGALIGVLIFVRINPLWSYLVIGVMMVISGINLLRKKVDEQTPDDLSPLARMVIEILIGLALGALGAITGLMLGSLRLPMMIRYMRMDMKEAIGTNLVVGCVIAAIGTATNLVAGESALDGLVLIAVVPPTLLGGWLGAALTGRFSKSAVKRFAGSIVVLTGAVMVGQGTVGTLKHPQAAEPPVVEEWDEDDDWLDLDYPLPHHPPPPKTELPDDAKSDTDAGVRPK